MGLSEMLPGQWGLRHMPARGKFKEPRISRDCGRILMKDGQIGSRGRPAEAADNACKSCDSFFPSLFSLSLSLRVCVCLSSLP